VTEIGWCAFENCTSLQSVVIPDSVADIGEMTFTGCTSLQTIYCQINSLINISMWFGPFAPSHFDSVTLIVPPGTIEVYRHHPVFGKFKNIEIASRREGNM